jgi:phage-related protein
MFRTVVYYGDHFYDFFVSLNPDVQDKFRWTLDLIESVLWVPKRYLKHIEGTAGLYEIRVEYNSDIYRVFCFFDHGNLVVLINGFQKKKQKTPKQEIVRAGKLMKQYFHEKQQKNKR